MKKFFIYFLGFVIVFFIAPAICTVTPSTVTANVENNKKMLTVQND